MFSKWCSKVILGTVCFSVVVVLSGCASSDRMMRISPLSEDQDDEFSSTERANVWPFYYHDNGLYSVLWPFIDWDKDGVAVRPLYNQEKDDHSILFPLSAWNPVDKDGWVLTGYWGPKSHGLFPLYNHNYQMNRSNLNYYTLFWYTQKNRGIFPFFSYGEFYHFLTAYYDTSDSSYGLWPVYFHDKHEILVPLIYFNRSFKDYEKSEYLLGLLGGSFQDKYRAYSYLVPFYYRDENKETSESTKHIYPLYYQNRSPKKTSSLFIPFYYQQEIGSEKLLVTPLFGYSNDTSGAQSLTNVLGPVYIERKHKDYYYKSVLWPFYTEYKDAQSQNVKFFPLYSKVTKGAYSKTDYVLDLVCLEDWPHGKMRRFFPFGRYRSGEAKATTKLENSADTFWSYENKGNGRWKHRLFPFYNNNGNTRSVSYRYLFGLGKTKRPVKVGDDSVETVNQLWPFFSVANNKKKVSCYTSQGFYAFGKYNSFSDPNHGLSIFSALIFDYSSFQRKAAPKPSTVCSYLLFGNHSHQIYKSQIIPKPLKNWTQKVSRVKSSEFLIWDKEEVEFKIWKSGELTNKEMAFISQWTMDFTKFNEGMYNRTLKVSAPTDSTVGLGLKLPRPELLIEIKKILDRKQIDYSVSIDDGLIKLAEKCSRSRTERSHSVWPFYSYVSAEEGSELEILWGLINSTQRKDYGRTSFLKYLFRSEREGDSVRRDMIPFITIDSGENSGFSFLGDFFKFRKNKTGRYGSFLFIDWGKHPSH